MSKCVPSILQTHSPDPCRPTKTKTIDVKIFVSSNNETYLAPLNSRQSTTWASVVSTMEQTLR